MTDNDPKTPMVANFAPIALTAVGSSAVGDKVGDALADVLTWLVQLSCHCAPPPVVASAFHTICVEAIVISALFVHYLIIKNNQQKGT